MAPVAARRALVFIVDDDPLVLRSLTSLLELETDFRVRGFSSGEAVLDALAGEAPDVLVTDLTMPGLGGLAVLERARQARPDTARIVLTGYADKESALRAINTAGVYQFIEKPWDNGHLLMTLGNAVREVELGQKLQSTLSELRGRNLELERALAELHDAQDRLIAAERLAAVGRLATGIAHEIGNQLSLLGYAELIAERYAGDPELHALTDPLIAARRRLSTMVSSIKEFVRAGASNGYSREPQRLAPILDEALSILRFEPALKLRTVERAPWDDGAEAAVNHEKILQVALNLLGNAIQATREGGKIRIGLEKLSDGRGARFLVEDDGCGIAPKDLPRIWEPFFSTKGEAGTGLGLGICRRIVEEHGGRITVASEPGHGARFTVDLPLGAGAPSP
jgi:signal transduction histidine kinase